MDICTNILTETWLDESVSDVVVCLDKLQDHRVQQIEAIREDGGWCVSAYTSTKGGDADIVPVFLLSPVVVSIVFFAANIKAAAQVVGEDAMLAKYCRAPAFIVRNFKTCRLDRVLP